MPACSPAQVAGQQLDLQIPSHGVYVSSMTITISRFAPATAVLCLALAACGEQPKSEAPDKPAALAAPVLPTGPVLSGVGVLSTIEGSVATIDHEAVAGGLPAGRNAFKADAAVLAEAPLEPGSRVAFSYQDWKPRPLLTELKAR
jgi:hypothetical protein